MNKSNMNTQNWEEHKAKTNKLFILKPLSMYEGQTTWYILVMKNNVSLYLAKHESKDRTSPLANFIKTTQKLKRDKENILFEKYIDGTIALNRKYDDYQDYFVNCNFYVVPESKQEVLIELDSELKQCIQNSDDKFAYYITQYIQDFPENFKDEKYKWVALKHFQNTWDINAPDFIKMFENAVSKQTNLLDIGIKQPVKMIKIYSETFGQERIRQLFKMLYDETIDLKTRITSFLKNISEINNELDGGKWHTYHDANTLSIYLWFRYPDKYSIFKITEFKQFISALNLSFEFIQGHQEDNLLEGLNLINLVKQKITANAKLLNIFSNYADENCYEDTSYNTLAQDFIYYVCKQVNNQENLKIQENNEENKMSENSTNLIPLNQILYGPPGTGKTYNTVIEAIKILDKDLYDKYINSEKTKNDYKILKDEFDNYKKSGQIDFVTFHQSYSYEEFVEGIRPVVPDGEEWNTEPAELKYTGKDGIFKKIVNDAKSEFVRADKNTDIKFDKASYFKMSLGANWEDETSEIFSYCVQNNVIALGYGDNIDFSETKTVEEIRNKFEKNNTEIKSAYDFNLRAVERFKLWMKQGDIVFISNGNFNIKAIAQIEGDYFFDNNTEIRYNHFRKVKWLYVGDNIPVRKIIDRQLTQASIYAFDNKNINKDYLMNLFSGNIDINADKKPYVLIIDEVNRGNISKIFGELITLLEPDKRLGEDNELTVTLPYSKQKFGVPKNLYIIGTMNTSDRSIASIDIALRRRFKFKEMMPDSKLIPADVKICNTFLKDIFKTLNRRITVLLDRDHQIGHSYFMNIEKEEDFKKVWFDSIEPLLNEYFYGDWEKLQAMLGKAKEDGKSFITKIEKVEFANGYSCDDDDKYDFAGIEKFSDNEDFKQALINAKLIKAEQNQNNEDNQQ